MLPGTIYLSRDIGAGPRRRHVCPCDDSRAVCSILRYAPEYGPVGKGQIRRSSASESGRSAHSRATSHRVAIWMIRTGFAISRRTPGAGICHSRVPTRRKALGRLVRSTNYSPPIISGAIVPQPGVAGLQTVRLDGWDPVAWKAWCCCSRHASVQSSPLPIS